MDLSSLLFLDTSCSTFSKPTFSHIGGKRSFKTRTQRKQRSFTPDQNHSKAHWETGFNAAAATTHQPDTGRSERPSGARPACWGSDRAGCWCCWTNLNTTATNTETAAQNEAVAASRGALNTNESGPGNQILLEGSFRHSCHIKTTGQTLILVNNLFLITDEHCKLLFVLKMSENCKKICFSKLKMTSANLLFSPQCKYIQFRRKETRKHSYEEAGINKANRLLDALLEFRRYYRLKLASISCSAIVRLPHLDQWRSTDVWFYVIYIFRLSFKKIFHNNSSVSPIGPEWRLFTNKSITDLWRRK